MILNSLTLEDLSKNDEILVVVGANPALCDELLIDRTNSNLISILKSNSNKHKTYKAYCLINLYNEIAGNFCDFYNTNPHHSNSNETMIVNFLKYFTNSELLSMWGSTFKKTYKPKSSGQLYAWVNSNTNNVFVSANAKNDFCHGSIASQIIKYSINIKNIW